MSVRMKTYVVHMVNVSTYQFGTIVSVRVATTSMKTLEGVKVSCLHHNINPFVMLPGPSDVLQPSVLC